MKTQNSISKFISCLISFFTITIFSQVSIYADSIDSADASKTAKGIKIVQLEPKKIDFSSKAISSIKKENPKNSLTSSEIELKWDATEPNGYCYWTTEYDTACVTFEAVTGGRLDSIKVALLNTGSIEGAIWSYTGSEAAPLGHQLSGLFWATVNQSATTPFPVPYQNWASVDLRSYSISTDQPFAVAFIIGYDPSIPGIMTTDYSSQVAYHSLTYLQYPGYGYYPGWYFITTSTSTIAIYLIRAYVSISLLSPTLASPADGSTNVSLNPTLSWNNISNALNYSLQVSTDPNFNSTVVNVSGISNTSFQLSNLSNGLTYYWRVNASYSNGISDWSQVWRFTTLGSQILLPVVQTNAAANIGIASATLNGTVNPNSSSTDVQFEYGTTASYGNAITAAGSPFTGNTNLNVNANLSGLASNTLYHFRIKATNGSGTSYGSDIAFRTLFNYPGSIDLVKTFSFNDPSKSSSFRLIGIPGQTNFSISQLLTGNFKEDWDAYYDNGNVNDYLIEYDGSPTFQFKPGNGFWMLSKNLLNLSKNVPTVILSADNSYQISLHNGWNIISNPFEKGVIWDSVIKLNSLPANSIIYSWNGAWTQASVFNTLEGYYFYNQQNLNSLKISYNPADIAGKEINKLPRIHNEIDKTELKLSLILNDNEKSFVIIAIDSAANDDFDEQDILAPPGDFEETNISLFNKSLSSTYKMLIKETRSEIGEGKIFNAKIKNNLNQKLLLQVEGMVNFNNYEIYLLDNSLHKFYDLHNKNNIEIKPSSNEKDFQIIIGSRNFIENIKIENIPVEFFLSDNYPNPFNPVTTIEYSIPQKELVIIKIFDILGKDVKTLINEIKAPGYYQIDFNAKSFASGIYFYRMESGSFITTKKLILVK